MQKQTRVYPISIVAKLTGLSQRQIRYYESMEVISPSRSKGKQRLYSSSEIDTLLAVKILLGRGLTLQGIRNMINTQQFTDIIEKTLDIPRIDYDAALNDTHPKKSSSHNELINQLLHEHSDTSTPAGQDDKGGE